MIPIRWKNKKYWIERDFIFDVLKKEKVIKLPIKIKQLNIDEDWNNLKLDRVKKANLKFPIIINPDFEVIDGLHRIKKSLILNKQFVNCKIFNLDNYMSNMIEVNHYEFN